MGKPDRKETIPVAEVLVDLRNDRDWSNVLREVDIDTGKSYIHGLSEAEGAYLPFYLYIPKVEDSIGARVCPGVDSIGEINTDCENGYNKFYGEEGISSVNYTGIDYWRIEGVAGSGGMNLLTDEAGDDEAGDDEAGNNENEDNEQDAENDQQLSRTGEAIIVLFLTSLVTILVLVYRFVQSNKLKQKT